MRLLIAADIFPPESGGPATYAVTLANELVKRGDSVTIVSLNPQSDASVVSCNMYHVTWSLKPLRYLQYLYLLIKYARQADIIYAMGPVNAGLPALVVARLLRKKFVVKVVGDYAWEQWQSSIFNFQSSAFVSVDAFQNQKMGGKIGWLRKVERFVCQRADAVIVPSDYLKMIVTRWEVPVNKITVKYNFVEFTDVPSAPKPAGEKWIVSVARLLPWKGMDTLIKIMPEILKSFPHAKLKIVGGGPEFESLQNLVSQTKLQYCVEITGNLPKNKTLSYIKAADVFILNSGYEGFSHAALEALYFGLGGRMALSNVGGNPEVDLDKKNLFEYNDKLKIIDRIVSILQVDESFHFGSEQTKIFKDGAALSLSKKIAETANFLEKICAS